MLEFRPIATHPALVPVLGILAVIVALMILPFTREAAAPDAPIVRAAVPAADAATPGTLPSERRDAVLGSVGLAANEGEPDVFTVRVGDRTVHLLATSDTRVLFTTQGDTVVAGTADLPAGAQLDLELAPGATFEDGAELATVRYDDGTVAPGSA